MIAASLSCVSERVEDPSFSAVEQTWILPIERCLSSCVFFCHLRAFFMERGSNTSTRKAIQHPRAAHSGNEIHVASYHIFFLLYHLLNLLWNICLRLKKFELSLSFIKVLGLVFTTAFIKAASSEAFAGDTYVLMNDLLHLLPQIRVYFLISRFYLISKFYFWCSVSKAEFVFYTFMLGVVYFCIHTFKRFRLFMCVF